jgi:GntR family transcriptional regulator
MVRLHTEVMGMDVASRVPALPSSRGAPIPKYHRVKEELRRRIASGIWHTGSPIPSEPELCDEFGVSRITVRKAIGDLVHEGRLRTVQGKGTFVVTPKLGERFVQRAFGIYEDMERRGLRLSTTILRQEILPAPPEVATRLDLSIGEPIHHIERIRSVEGEKLLLSVTYIPQGLCSDLVHDDLSSGSLYRHLAERYGLTIGHGERSMEAVAAGQREAQLLGLALASPLLLMDIVAYLPNGRPFEYSRVLHRGDRARIEITFFPASSEG